MERQGSGLNKIVEDYELAANYTQELKPVFTSTRSAFFVKLWNLNYNSSRFKKPIEAENGAKNEAKNEAKKVPKSYSRSQLLLNENQKNILKFMRRNPSITQQQIMENAFLSRATLQREIKVLIERGFLERTGSARNGTWVVKKIR
jgi:predicted HTH transcriptional regulator